MSTQMKTASLSGNLLARKGTALPAKLVTAQSCPAPQNSAAAKSTPPSAHLRKVPGDAPGGSRGGASGDTKPHDGEARARITLRLDADRHLKLKLAGAHLRRSSQQILVEALDSYLKTSVPILMDDECGCLKARQLVPREKATYVRKTPSWDN